jgi:Lar family restriction alleviation protein
VSGHDIARELKPCPFCGGEAKRITIGENEPSNAGGDIIFCTRCQACSHVEFGRKENLVDRWNTRAVNSHDALVEALRTTAGYLEEAANVIEGKGLRSLAGLIRPQIERARAAISLATVGGEG